MTVYHYTECGLNNVFIEGIDPVLDDEGDEIVVIPAINLLHKMIAHGIVCHGKGISGAELRFLRTEMGLTQAELSTIAHCDKQTIGRWERSETDIDGAAEVVIRRLSIEMLHLDVDSSTEELSRKSIPSAASQTIQIKHSGNEYALQGDCMAA